MSTSYVTLAALKTTLGITNSVADADLTADIAAASRAVDGLCGRHFYQDLDASKQRFYTPESFFHLEIDDLAAKGTPPYVAIDRGNTGAFAETWTEGTDFVLEPLNAAQDAQQIRSWERLRVRRLSGRWLPCGFDNSVRITGQFGWATFPDEIVEATGILAAKLFKRRREAPFGILTVGGEMGGAMRLAKSDPDISLLLQDYTRLRPLL